MRIIVQEGSPIGLSGGGTSGLSGLDVKVRIGDKVEVRIWVGEGYTYVLGVLEL